MKFPHQEELARYNQMPKDFVGPTEADVLFSMHEAMMNAHDSWSYLYVAGSAAAESGLMATHLDKDERHDRIDAAESAWREAQDRFIFKHHTDEWSNSKRYSIPDRIEMHRLFCVLYHDMVDENVTATTMQRLHQNLIHLAAANIVEHDDATLIGDYGAIAMRRGLAYELGTLMTITRLMCPSFFAIPATARADHGGFFPEQTHDVRLIQQSWGEVQWCVPYEVKPADGPYTERYRSAFVRGRVELLLPSSSEPLDLTRYMDAEQKGTLPPQHVRELNEITSRVLTLAGDYKKRQLGTRALVSA